MPEDPPIPAVTDPADADRLIDFLRDRDAACPQCQYNLRNLTSPRCPECGREVQLGVTLVEPDLRPWISIMVAASATAGLGFFWCLGLAFGSAPPSIVLISVFMQIAAIPAVPILIAKRRAFMKWSVKSQWKFAAWVIGYVLVSMVVIFTAIILHA